MGRLTVVVPEVIAAGRSSPNARRSPSNPHKWGDYLGIPQIVKVWCIQLKEGEALFQANFYNRASPESPAI